MIIWQDENKSITLFKSAIYETLSTVVKTDDCIIVADPCFLPHEVQEIRDYIEDIREQRPLYLLFTHSDFDHIIGAKAFPDAMILASIALQNKSRTEKEKIMEQMIEFDEEHYITRDYELVYPDVHTPIAGEGTVITIGKTRLTFYQAPGHTDDGIFMVIEPLGVLLVGDYFSDIEFPFIYYSSDEYEKTIGKLEQLLSSFTIRLLVPGHGNPTSKSDEMWKRQRESLEYIRNTRNMIEKRNDVGLEKIITGCKFPRILKKCHEENIKQIQMELESLGRM